MELNTSKMPNEANYIKDPNAKPLTDEERRKKRRNRIIWIAVFIVVNGAVIAYTAVDEFSRERPEKLGYTFGISNVMFIVAGFGCMLAALALETIKYLLMMRSLGEKVSVKAAFQTAALGKYYDNITPSGAGGQPFQIYNMYKFGYSKGASAAMPLSGFLFMQMGFVFLAILVFIFRGNAVETAAIKVPAYIGVICYSIVPGFIILFAISHKTAQKILTFLIGTGAKIRIIKKPEDTLASVMNSLEEYHRSLLMITRDKSLVIKLFALSFVYQAAISSIPFFVLHAYKGTGNYFDILAMTVFIYCAITIIPTPGNSGAAEGSFYLIFSRLDYSGLFWAMLIWRLICYYSFILIGILIYAYNALTARKQSMQQQRRIMEAAARINKKE